MSLYSSLADQQRPQQAAPLHNQSQLTSATQPLPSAGAHQPNPYLSPNQQDLLLAALNSQPALKPSAGTQHQQVSASDTVRQPAAMGDNPVFQSPQDGDLDNFEYTPDLDFDGDNSFDFENADLGGDMIGALPGGDGEHAEKRKSRDESTVPEEGDSKRQEGEEGEKVAKKPGRKPLMTEPTTKRKAQNRAAQRAFRERKEAHLKDLETKVTELTKNQESDKHENGLLKAQVDRLQVELREYRKRLSLNSSRMNGSPPLTAYSGQQISNSVANGNSGFQFEFPKFGGLPGSQLLGKDSYANTNASGVMKRSSVTPPVLTRSPSGSVGNGSNSTSQQNSRPSRENSQSSTTMSTTMSPNSDQFYQSTTSPSNQVANSNPAFTSYSTSNNMHGFASTLPQMNDDAFGGLFSPSILKTASSGGSFDNNYFASPTQPSKPLTSTEGGHDLGGNSTAGLSRAFQFNSGSNISDSASPASSMSQWNANNANSSCGTSPEPSHDSPANKDKTRETFSAQISPLSNNAQHDQLPNTNNANFLSNANFNVPSLDSFDPVLFGDYRDTNDAIVGGGDFTGGFFNEALDTAPFDYGSPSNLFGILQSPQQTHQSLNTNASTGNTTAAPSKKCLEDCDKIRDGGDDDYGLPGTNTTSQQKQESGSGKLISCNNIWNQLQANSDFQDGKFDLDSLCSELRSKARCSESGVMVDQDHVDAALRKLGKKDDAGNTVSPPPFLMFEQESWDKVLQKMNRPM